MQNDSSIFNLFMWRTLGFVISTVSRIPFYFFGVLFLADSRTVGGGHHLFNSFWVINAMSWYFAIAANDVPNPWFWNGILYCAFFKAIIIHFRRDKARLRKDPGQLSRWIMAFVELFPIPDAWLQPVWQWRVWAPLFLWLSSYAVAIVCPATATLMRFSAIVSFVLPGIYQYLRESMKRGRMETMIAAANQAMGPAPYVPRNGKRGAWLNNLQHQLRDQWEFHNHSTEHVNCPACGITLVADGMSDQAIVVCSACETDFVIERSTPVI